VGTRNLVAELAALKSRPRVLISASAVGYYGDRGDSPCLRLLVGDRNRSAAMVDRSLLKAAAR
jgi:hypothetical protein